MESVKTPQQNPIIFSLGNKKESKSFKKSDNISKMFLMEIICKAKKELLVNKFLKLKDFINKIAKANEYDKEIEALKRYIRKNLRSEIQNKKLIQSCFRI